MIQDIRGRGLFIGVELNQVARPICEALAKEGILCKDTKENTIRFAPPLVITKDELDYAIERIKKVIK